MPSPEFENLVLLLSAGKATPDMPLIEIRAGLDALGDLVPPAPGVTLTEVDAGGVPADWAVADGGEDAPVVLYLHGGGYVIGSRVSHRPLATRLAAAIGGRVLLPEYRLAPEHPAPAAIDDAVTAYRWLLDQGIDPQRIVVAGESAGGGLAASVLTTVRDEGLPLPAAGLLLSPWVDLALSGATITTHAELDLLLSPELLELWAEQYAGELGRTDPRVSPLYADLVGLPPLFVQVGTREVLLDDATRLVERALAAAVDVELVIAEGMIHIWQLFAGMVPEADEAVAQAVGFAKRFLPNR